MIERIAKDRHRFRCIQAFVAEWGEPFEWQKKPQGFRWGESQLCFANALQLMHRQGLVYVEGYACLPEIPLPFHHAWNVESGSNKVIDVTSASFRHYFGVPFDHDFINHIIIQHGGFLTVLDDWRNNWPMLRMSDEEIELVIHKQKPPGAGRRSTSGRKARPEKGVTG